MKKETLHLAKVQLV